MASAKSQQPPGKLGSSRTKKPAANLGNMYGVNAKSGMKPPKITAVTTKRTGKRGGR